MTEGEAGHAHRELRFLPCWLTPSVALCPRSAGRNSGADRHATGDMIIVRYADDVPAPVAREPEAESGACFAGRVARAAAGALAAAGIRRRIASGFVRVSADRGGYGESQTSWIRASPATAPRLPGSRTGNAPAGHTQGISPRFPCKELPRMPGSSTYAGDTSRMRRHSARVRAAFARCQTASAPGHKSLTAGHDGWSCALPRSANELRRAPSRMPAHDVAVTWFARRSVSADVAQGLLLAGGTGRT